MFMGSEVLVHEAVVSFGSWGYYFRVLWFGAVGAFSSGSIGLATLSFYPRRTEPTKHPSLSCSGPLEPLCWRSTATSVCRLGVAAGLLQSYLPACMHACAYGMYIRGSDAL